VTFAREKRLLLGVLAWLAPLPLPFNELLSWPVLALYLVAVTAFLHRAAGNAQSWLPNWALNLLGLAYLPVLFFDFVRGGALLRPVVHVAMFGVVVKLFALRREKDKWQTLLGVFFLFLAAMGTSVHPTMVLYLLVVLGLSMTLLTRFSVFSVLARFGYRDPGLGQVPLRPFLVASTLAALLVAVPLFAVLPRMGTPYIFARGMGTGTEIGAAGFSDVVTLDSIGSIRGNEAVAMRLQFPEGEAPRHEVRIKGATFERYRNRVWRRSDDAGSLTRPRGTGGRFELAPFAVAQRVKVWLRPIGTSAIPVPVNTADLAIQVTDVRIDRGGALMLSRTNLGSMEYEVGLADRPFVSSVPDLPPGIARATDGTLDPTGLTPRMATLAADLIGGLAPAEAARELERHLSTEYRYTTDLVGRGGAEPLETFLFETRRGHCEYFASSMVLLLRSQGIPARLVTGFLGAELNRLEGYHVVRQSNAHAWVEAYVPESGWTLFDPTPPDGRPQVRSPGLPLMLSQAWDFVVFRWDRYVLTFGLYDQMQIFSGVVRTWRSWWRQLRGPEAEQVPEPPVGVEGDLPLPTEPARQLRDWKLWVAWILGLVAILSLGAMAWLAWRGHRSFDATRAYQALRGRLDQAGIPVRDSTAPLDLERRARERFPELASPTRSIVRSYLAESFGGHVLEPKEVERIRGSLRVVGRELGRRRVRGGRGGVRA
jgi:transglutaminase-like putative cysteine protease